MANKAPIAGQEPTVEESPSADLEVLLSELIPQMWLAKPGRTTPSGLPATYSCSIHALMALRLKYRCDVMGQDPSQLIESRDRYQSSWQIYNRHGSRIHAIVLLVEDGDTDGAVLLWNDIDQGAVQDAYCTVIGERELIPPGNDVNLMTMVWREYDLEPPSVPIERHGRKSRRSDSESAWLRSGHGRCNGCGTRTISPGQRDDLHELMQSQSSGFNLIPTYEQHSGKIVPVWERVTRAATAVADHIVPRTQGGPTDISNLTNACTGCNNSRQHASMDSMGIQAYTRPDSELEFGVGSDNAKTLR